MALPSRWGIIVDVAAIAAVTFLALAKVLPEAVTASVITMVVAGRFRPPGDSGTPPSPTTGRSELPPAVTEAAGRVSGVLSVLGALGHLIRR